jgi:hypothetical protein
MGLKLIGEYTHINATMDLICICGKDYKSTLGNLRAGKRCCGRNKQLGVGHHAWITDREALKVKNKFKKACYSLVRRSLKHKNKNKKTQDLLGYSSCDLQNHIINHPEYNSCLNSGYQISIDHIFPLKAFEEFNLLNEDHIWLVNSLDNLKPSTKQWNSKKWNSKKNCKYNKIKFQEFLLKHNIICSQTFH